MLKHRCSRKNCAKRRIRSSIGYNRVPRVRFTSVPWWTRRSPAPASPRRHQPFHPRTGQQTRRGDRPFERCSRTRRIALHSPCRSRTRACQTRHQRKIRRHRCELHSLRRHIAYEKLGTAASPPPWGRVHLGDSGDTMRVSCHRTDGGERSVYIVHPNLAL